MNERYSIPIACANTKG